MPKMFVISQAPPKKNKFVVRTEANKTHPCQSSQQPFNPKLNSNLVTCHSSNSSPPSNHVLKTVHMNMNQALCNNRPLLKKKLKFHFSIVKNYPQIEKRFKKIKDGKIKQRRMNKDQNYASGRWKLDEHKRFVEAIINHGNDWKQVQKCVRTRSSTQARSHAQKFFGKIKKASIFSFNLDLSKSSIKRLHDLVTEMSPEEYEKTMTALINVAFERRSEKRNKTRDKTLMNSNDSSSLEDEEDDNDMNHDMSSDEDSSFTNINNDHGLFNFNEPIMPGHNNINLNAYTTKCISMSIDIEDKAPIMTRQKRSSINSIEGFYNNHFDEKEKDFAYEQINEIDYMMNFDKTFNTKRMENDHIQVRSRRMSLEDDYLFNYVMKQKP